MPGKMAFLDYTANNGTHYSAKTRLRYLTALNANGGAAALGFGPYDPALPGLPRGMKMRGVYVTDPTGGATRAIPVGSVDAPAWTGAATTIQIDYSGIGTMTDANITGPYEETPAKRPHIISNKTDAS